MSWDSYLESLKTPDNQGFVAVREAAIWGFESGKEAKWASTDGLNSITTDEIKKLCKDRTGVTSFVIGGTKCMMLGDKLDVDGENFMNLKTIKDSENNAYNVCVGKSKQALIIAFGTKLANGGHLCEKVSKITKYLLDANM